MKTKANFKPKNGALAAIGKTMKAITPEVLASMTKNSVADSAAKVEEAPKKTGFLKRLGQAAGGLLKQVAPIAASFIPGVGPIASQVLSTLNDDEWFGEFKSAGATFNELLVIQDKDNFSSEPLTDIVGAAAFCHTLVLNDSYWKDQVLPSILAYVRNKTSNVLNASEADYWNAVIAGSNLYAIYYAIEKYIQLASNLPLNIPNLTAVASIASPLNYSMLVGIREALKGYLQSTIKLPYAWIEYLRWRFGTTFKSSNTGKPGLIFYDPIEDFHKLTPSSLETLIDAAKATLVTAGRAVADIKLAYDDHQLRYDVEESHYDEKEFNLRSNFWTNLQGEFGTREFCSVYMDSRLDSSAALQAVTISTNGSVAMAPLPTVRVKIAVYASKTYPFPYEDSNGQRDVVTFPAGWLESSIPMWIHSYSWKVNLNGTKFDGHLKSDHILVAQEPVEADAAEKAIKLTIAAYAADTLEFHNLAAGFSMETVGGTIVGYARGKSLAYDTAYITSTQVDAIHRMALRNLFRGNYKVKVAPSVKTEIKDAVTDVVEVVKDEMIEKI